MICWLISLGGGIAWAQPCGLSDTLLIPQNTGPNFTFEVFDLFNDDLSDAAQGVCRVEIKFLHQYVDKLELSLVSPSGQSVQLIGPNTDQQGEFTFFSVWDISFVQCSDTPDPDFGSMLQWNNNQMGNFTNGGNYSGSYYPFQGCLEDFDTGPANGTWTLNVNNNPSATYLGAIIGFRIEFCDARGLDCCFADAGRFEVDSLLSCVGDSSLNLLPLPVYNDTPPDTAEYGYTYLIGDRQLLIEVDSMPDLRGFAPGSYQVCGLSYKLEDADSLPAPDGLLRLDSLRNRLNSFTPPFCGKLSEECLQVDILPPPPLLIIDESICQGDTYALGDSLFTASGFYELRFTSFAGCDSVVQLNLSVIPTVDTALQAAICAGETFAVGDSLYTASGTYVDTLAAASGCDSIVNLTLEVLQPVVFDTSLTLCQGEAFVAGDSLLTEAGVYELLLLSSRGCDSLLRVDLFIIEVAAVTAMPDTLSCALPSTLLDGSASTPTGLLDFQWFGPSGLPLGNQPTQLAEGPGAYVLEVVRSQGGAVCSAYDTLLVAINTLSPVADAGLRDTLTCNRSQLTLGGPGSSMGPAFAYEWFTPDGNITGPVFGPTAIADEAGTYFLAVTNIDNRCSDTASVIIIAEQEFPLVVPGADTLLSCDRPSVQLTGSGSSAGPEFEYRWSSLSGTALMGADNLSINIQEGGTYQLWIRNTLTACQDSATINIGYDTIAPKLSLSPPLPLTCLRTSAELTPSITDIGPLPGYTWTTSNGSFSSSTTNLAVTVDAPGRYQLIAENQRNGCRDTAVAELQSIVTDVVAAALPPDTLDCVQPTVSLSANGSSSGANIVYRWSSPLTSFADTLGFDVSTGQPGTYQLTVVDTLNGCSDSVMVEVLQDSLLPIADAGPNRLLTCDSSSVTLDGSASSQVGNFDYDWFDVASTGLVASGELRPVVSSPGVYLLIVTDTDNGCFDTSLVSVGIDTLSPVSSIAVPAVLNCSRTSLVLDGSASSSGPGFSFAWAATQGGVFAGGEDSLFPTVATSGAYELTITNDSTGCQSSAIALVRDTLSEVTASAAAMDTLSCVLEQASLDGSASSSGPDLIYEWTTTDGNLLSGANTPIALADAPGFYQLTVLDTFTACSDTLLIELLLNEVRPVAAAGDSMTLDCSQPSLFLDGSASSAGPEFIYEWQGPCILSGGNTPAAEVGCPGFYALQVTDTLNGCTSVDTVFVAQDDNLPTADTGGPYQLDCESPTLTLNGNGSSQGPRYVYSWSGPGLLNGGSGLSPQVNLPGTYTLSVTDTLNACVQTASVLIVLDTLQPVADAGPQVAITCDLPTVAIGSDSSSQGAIFFYAWTGPSGGLLGSTDQSFATASLPGIYELTVLNTTNGCTATSQVEVQDLTQLPIADAGGPQLLDCTLPTAALGGSNSSAGPNIVYEWQGPCLTGPADAPQTTANCEGIYRLTLRDTLTGCTAADEVVISRDPLMPNAVLPDSLLLSCSVGTVIIDATASQGDAFRWLFAGQPLAETGLSLLADAPGTYTLIASNAAGDCQDTASVSVLLDCRPQAVLAPADTLSCARTLVTLDATASVLGDSVLYTWLPPDTNCIASGQGSLQITVRCPGLYRFVATNTVFNLSDTATVEVVINDTPPVADAGQGSILTCDEPFALLDGSASSTSPGISHTWTRLDDENYRKDSLSITVNVEGTYFLTVIDSTNGCFAEDIVVVQRSDDLPGINFGSTVIPCLQDTFWLQAFVSPAGPEYSYAWTGDVILGATDSSAVLVDTAGTLQLRVTNELTDCSSFRDVTLTQQDCVPCLSALPADSLTCAVEQIALSASFCKPCEGCSLEWTTDDGLFLSAVDSLTVTVGAPGLYTLTATDTLGFSASVQLAVQQNTAPPAVDAGPDLSLSCQDTVAMLGGSLPADPNLAYQWESSNGLPTAQDTLLSLSVSQADTFVLRAVDRTTGCTASDQAIVTWDTLPPTANAGPSLTLTCEQPTLALDGSSSDFGFNFTYSWSGPAGAPIAGANTFNPVVSQAGIYILTVMDTLNGCQRLDSVEVLAANDLPELPLLTDTVLTCANESLILLGSVPAGGSFSSCWYRLDGSGQPVGPCVPSLFIDIGLPGNYRFEVTNDSTACSNAIDITVSEDKTPPQLPPLDSLLYPCSADSLLISLPAEPQSAGLAYEWSNPSGLPIAQDGGPGAVVFGPGFYRVEVQRTDNGCTATSAVLVLEDERLPQLQAGPDTLVSCRQDRVRLSADFSTESGTAQWLWQTADGLILSGADSPQPQVGEPGVYLVQLTDPLNGCTAVDSVLVADGRLFPQAQIDASPLLLSCAVDSLLLDATPTASGSGAGVSYEWRRGAFNVLGTGPQQWVAEIGSYQLFVTDLQSGCRDTLPLQVNGDFQNPTVMIADPGRINCQQTSVTLNPDGSSAGAGFTYTWLGPTGGVISTLPEPLQVDSPGIYTLQIENLVNGCLSTASVEVESDAAFPEVAIAEPLSLNCSRTEVSLDGSNSAVDPSIVYRWSVGSAGLLSGPVDGEVAVAVLPGWYLLEVRNTANGCVAVDSVEVTSSVDLIEEVRWQALPPACPGDANGRILLDTILGGTPPFLAALDDGVLRQQLVFDQLVPGTYRLSVEDANGCTQESLVDVPEAVGTTVSLGPELSIKRGEELRLMAEVNPPGVDSIWWWPEDGQAEGLSYLVRPDLTTLYQVWVRNESGCIATSQVLVKVLKDLPVYAPNAFSPNGDGQNDVFLLFAGESVETVELLRIFDRWGNLVFEGAGFPPNDPAYGWDGSLRGQPMDGAVFVFYAEVLLKGGQKEVLRGDVLLLR